MLTVWRLPDSPSLRVRVTGPAASDQVMVKGLPTATLNWVLVRITLAKAALTRVARVKKDFILAVCMVLSCVKRVERETAVLRADDVRPLLVYSRMTERGTQGLLEARRSHSLENERPWAGWRKQGSDMLRDSG